MVAAFPVAIDRQKIDTGAIFAERPPWVADIVEKVGAQHMPPEALFPCEALAQHTHCAAADLVDGATSQLR